MNPYKVSNKISTQESIQYSSLPINESMILMKQSLIKTPEKDLLFDPNELMTADLIKTPLNFMSHDSSTEMPNGDFSQKFQDPYVLSKVAIRNRMVCHEDFPRLLDLLDQVKRAEATMGNLHDKSTEQKTRAIAKSMREKLGVNDFTILRGQCPLTDLTMQNYFTMLDFRLQVKPTAATQSVGIVHSIAPTGVLQSRMPLVVNESSKKNDDLTASDLISWAEDFLKNSKLIGCNSTSPLVSCKARDREANPLLQKKTACDKKKKVVKKKKTKTNGKKRAYLKKSAAPLVARTKTTRGKKQHSGNDFHPTSFEMQQERGAHRDIRALRNSKSPICKFSSFHSPTPTIASDISITLTPHPFKEPKTRHLPMSELIVKDGEPLSEITSQSIGNGVMYPRKDLGIAEAAPQIRLFCDGDRKTYSIEPTLRLQKMNYSKIDENNKSTAPMKTMKENSGSSNGNQSWKKIDEAVSPSNPKGVNDEKKSAQIHSVISDTKSPRFLSIEFPQTF